jgi:hypothetical protein
VGESGSVEETKDKNMRDLMKLLRTRTPIPLYSHTPILLSLCLLLCSCATPAADVATSAPDVESINKAYLYEAVRHLYRWYMDEDDVQKGTSHQDFVFWIRELHPKLDEGDKSRFGEVLMPRLGIVVTIKKPDYVIEEYGVEVKSDRFKIVNVARQPVPRRKPSDYAEIKVAYSEMLEHLFRTRSDVTYPEGDLLMRMRLAVRKSIQNEMRDHPEEMQAGDQVVYLAPLSPVANETWIFWETGRRLIHFSSDMDLENPALWDHSELAVDLYDVDEQVVVSFDEAAGSNAYLTRDQVGRALYNCVILGKRVVMNPKEAEAAEAEAKP